MFERLVLKFSSTQNTLLRVDLTPVTIFVGPNNSGKSRVLDEILSFSQHGHQNADNLILDSLTFKNIDAEEGNRIIDEITTPIYPDSPYPPEQVVSPSTGTTYNRAFLLKVLLQPQSNLSEFVRSYITPSTIKLDGKNRLQLIEPQQAGNLKNISTTSLQYLFKNDNLRASVRKIIYRAFKFFFVIDPTDVGRLVIRLSDTAPVDVNLERSLTSDSIEFYTKAIDIAYKSDGVKAFVGIITTIIAGEPRAILIDEPEAFLHPPLALALGKEACTSVQNGSKNLFASTHSAHFLMGCINSGVPLNIIRLTFSNNIPTARLLPADRVQKLMRHPLLRSTGVLNGLFYDYVVVTESDSDRAFYQEINERLLAAQDDRGIENCLFLNAQNKQTVREVIKPLREMGIPCAAILDIDVVKEGGQVWTKMLQSAFVNPPIIESTQLLRANVLKILESTNGNFKRNGGVGILDLTNKQTCDELFNQLDSYGIFTVRIGELECWLKSLRPKHTKTPEWLIEIFEKMGEDPTSNNYVKPIEGDVWDFVGEIKKWFENPSRKGIPN